ncbi:hypothetical protein EW145_g161 [Phellinidium pouzarii]|uniref:Kinesin motor domain-containing protein n=1 Tax=Phellinidium pouzarii TaxID=167371 RepID=A0A4S4LJB6_9AGAM|nr:hypothetical protein EW145_g161 [Phellinidium pouzarii]
MASCSYIDALTTTPLKTTMATRKTAATRGRAANPTAPARLTRAAAARSPSVAVEPPASPKHATTETTKARKPLINRNNIPLPVSKVSKVKASPKQIVDDDNSKAFLRIRPNVDDTEHDATPYLKSLSATTVQMTDLSGTNRIRLHPQAQLYTFSHVFPPETHQAEFFTKTTLPLVYDLLQGQNGLIFTYGVTNSGKTYTIQGGSQPDTAGLLPRTLDVVFNSLEGMHSNAPYRPVRRAGVEHASYDDPRSTLPEMSDEKTIADVLGELTQQDVDPTTVKVDKNYEYSIWISYAEVYNEKVYDLLSSDATEGDGASVCATPQGSGGVPHSGTVKKLPRATSTTWSNVASLATSSSADVLLVKRKALALKSDTESGGKYVSGLKCVRVSSTEEAKRVFRTGNINRRVFGTLANAVSSRSHGIFTLRAVRVHRGDCSDVSVSRLSIVDLAGSERSKNTHNTGIRLREAGNINKSLMVLGQCMEAMRSNQRRLAASLAAPGRGGLDVNNPGASIKLAIVPFRHSKLTELFQDFFVGDREGRAVMIVNVNPYDTGFDENSHVMRFAALAKGVTTAPAAAPLKASVRHVPPTARPGHAARTIHAPHRRKVTISTGGINSRKPSEAHLEIVEEDEESDEDNNEPSDLLVDALFEELEDLRIKLYESEMRCAVVEAETREEVMQEMEARMIDMERIFAKRLKHSVDQNDAKIDAKIDMLHQFGAFNGKVDYSESGDASFESRDTENSLQDASGTLQEVDDDDENEDDLSDDPIADLNEEKQTNSSFQDSVVESPLRPKVLSKSEKKRLGSGPPIIGLRDEDMAIDEMDADETMTIGDDDEDEDDEDEEEEIILLDDETDEVSSSDNDEGEDDEEEWTPSPKAASKGFKTDAKPEQTDIFKTSSKTRPKSSMGVSSLQKKMDFLSLFEDEDDETKNETAITDFDHDNANQGGSRDSSPPAKGKKSLDHLTAYDYEHVYEPAALNADLRWQWAQNIRNFTLTEDSFILLDALEKDADDLRLAKPRLCLEIGSGSGCISAFVGKMLGSNCLCICTDINEHASRCTSMTGRQNNISLEPILSSLSDALDYRISGGVDLLLFNPPYVPTIIEEAADAQEGRDIQGSWAGGKSGMDITNRVLDNLKASLHFAQDLLLSEADVLETTLVHGSLLPCRRQGKRCALDSTKNERAEFR